MTGYMIGRVVQHERGKYLDSSPRRRYGCCGLSEVWCKSNEADCDMGTAREGPVKACRSEEDKRLRDDCGGRGCGMRIHTRFLHS